MARLIYSAIMSLDGYTADASGNFDWAAPDQEVHTFVNELMRPVGTYLYGRRMYETMVYWETALDVPDQPPEVQDFAHIWQAADKIVYSSKLAKTSSARTRIERRFELQAIRHMGPGFPSATARPPFQGHRDLLPQSVRQSPPSARRLCAVKPPALVCSSR